MGEINREGNTPASGLDSRGVADGGYGTHQRNKYSTERLGVQAHLGVFCYLLTGPGLSSPGLTEWRWGGPLGCALLGGTRRVSPGKADGGSVGQGSGEGGQR